MKNYRILFTRFLFSTFSLFALQSLSLIAMKQSEKILSRYQQQQKDREEKVALFDAFFFFDSNPRLQDAILRACHGFRDLTKEEEKQIVEYQFVWSQKLIQYQSNMWSKAVLNPKASELFCSYFELDEEKSIWKFTQPDYVKEGHDIHFYLL